MEEQEKEREWETVGVQERESLQQNARHTHKGQGSGYNWDN